MIQERFEINYAATIGVDFMSKTIFQDDKILRLQIWDTAGQERFRSLIPSYTREAGLFVLVYSVNSIQSFKNCEKWLELEGLSYEKILLVGNIMSEKTREVTYQEGLDFSKKHGFTFIEISAKESSQTKQIITFICKKVFGKQNENNDKKQAIINNISQLQEIINQNTNSLQEKSNDLLQVQFQLFLLKIKSQQVQINEFLEALEKFKDKNIDIQDLKEIFDNYKLNLEDEQLQIIYNLLCIQTNKTFLNSHIKFQDFEQYINTQNSQICNYFIEKKESEDEQNQKILILGLDNSGKTTILYKLKLGEIVQSIPTYGFNVETLTYKDLKIDLWDIGGQDKIRPLWKHYFDNLQVLIFVIDASDLNRKEQVKKELFSLFENEKLINTPTLIYLNKSDQLQNSLEVQEEWSYHLKSNCIKQDDQWTFQLCNTQNGEGLYEGLEWIHQKIPKKQKRHMKQQANQEKDAKKEEIAISKNNQFRALMLGFDQSGKTTLMYQMKLKTVIDTVPTIGFNVETITIQNLDIALWDVGGSDKIRQLWQHYYQDSDCLIYVIDCQNNDRLQENIEILFQVQQEQAFKDKPLLIFLNKCEDESKIKITPQICIQGLKLNNNIYQQQWLVQLCSATKNIGVQDGLNWLSERLSKQQK